MDSKPRARISRLVTLGLAWALPSFGQPASPVAPPVEVRIQTAGRDGYWRVVYRFAKPVAGFDFQRSSRFQRAPAWRVETPGYAIGRGEGRETVRLAPGARPRREIRVAFPVDTRHLEKDYQLFERFSDGSLLLYTGHLSVVPAGASEDTPGTPNRLVLMPRRGEHLVVAGRVFRGRTAWTDAQGEETFVYFGRLVPLETEQMVAVLDPALPPWIERKLHDEIPRLFADYTRLTGFTLEARPTVLFSHRAAADPGSTVWKGGTLPGLIQMHIETAADAPEDRDLLERFFKFLAHEAAHLWNGQMFQTEGKNQSWMHEGGADAFAWRALHRAGLLDDAGLDARQAADLNACLARLGQESLAAAEERGEFRQVYTCGSLLAWLTEAAVRRNDPAADLHSFWAALFRAADRRDRRYDEALYLATLREWTNDLATVAFVEDFLHRPMPDRAARTLAAFRAAGAALRAAPEAMPAAQRAEWGWLALVALMRHDCDGKYSLSRRGNRFLIHGMPACRTLKTEVEIERLEDVALVGAGDAAYDALAARCRANGSVRLGGGANTEPMAAPCSMEIPPRPPWLEVVME